MAAAGPFTPEAVEPVCGIPAEDIRRMARELAAADRAAVYGRIGTCTQEFGTLASWLVDVLNVLTGNLDEPGGAMFTRAARGREERERRARPRPRRPRSGAGRAACRGLPEAFGELPVACLAEEIDTPGEGQVRALDHRRRQPGAVDAERGPPRRPRSAGSTSCSRSTST